MKAENVVFSFFSEKAATGLRPWGIQGRVWLEKMMEEKENKLNGK